MCHEKAKEMRKIKMSIKSILLLWVTWTGISCSNFLDMDIPDVLPDDEFWQNRSQVEAARDGVYTWLGSCVTYFMHWGDVRSGLYAYSSNNNTYAMQFTNQELLITNQWANWGTVYTTINNINSFIKNADRVLEYDPTMDEEVRQMVGEMYGLRALCYFYLVRAFEDVPLQLEPYESDTQEVNVPVSSQEVVLDTIESDLERALELCAESYSGADNYGRVTKKAVKAIWADVKLWRGDYQNCVTLCGELEQEYEGLWVREANWFTMFGNGNSVESIFEYQYSDDGAASPLYNFAVYAYSNLGTGNYQGNYTAYKREMDKVYAGTGARAFSDTVRTEGTTYCNLSGTRFDVYKYLGIASGYEDLVYRDNMTCYDAHFIFYRFREILLIKAEALGMLERYDEAVEAVNEIRKVTGLDETTSARMGTGDNFFDKLLAERCAELAYEGKQWFSMVRLAIHRDNPSTMLIERVANTHLTLTASMVRSRLQNRESWFMPYYDTEVERNHALEQKEYYKGRR